MRRRFLDGTRAVNATFFFPSLNVILRLTLMRARKLTFLRLTIRLHQIIR